VETYWVWELRAYIIIIILTTAARNTVPDAYFWLKSILRIDTQCVYVCKWFGLKFKPRFPESFKFGPGSSPPRPPPRGWFDAGFGTDSKTKDSQPRSHYYAVKSQRYLRRWVDGWRRDRDDAWDGWWTWVRLGGIKPKCRVLARGDWGGGGRG